MDWETSQMHILLAKQELLRGHTEAVKRRLDEIEIYIENINPGYISAKVQEMISRPEDRKLNRR